jgi:hypothetical protein
MTSPTPTKSRSDASPVLVKPDMIPTSGVPSSIPGIALFINCNPRKRSANPVINSPIAFFLVPFIKRNGRAIPSIGSKMMLKSTLKPK